MQGVLVDAGGVLTLPDRELVHRILSPFGVNPDDRTVDRAHALGVMAYDQADEVSGDHAFAQAYVAAAGVLASDVEDAARNLMHALRSATCAWATVRPGVTAALRQLRERCGSVAIVSNAFGTVESELRQLRVCQIGDGPAAVVDAIVDSAIVGYHKPDARIFQEALRRLLAEPSNVVHIGDSVRADVNGARAAGIRPLHFDPWRLCTATDHQHIERLSGGPHAAR